jgi:hypothetical protein
MPSKIHYKSNSHKPRIILSRGSLAREVGRGLIITFFLEAQAGKALHPHLLVPIQYELK